jgi:hypothetical protein
MYFDTKSYLKNTRNNTAEHTLKEEERMKNNSKLT